MEHRGQNTKGVLSMQDNEIQTVEENCTHPDCIYRGHIDGGWTPICMYSLIECKARNCKISECDKYKSGKKTKARMRKDIVIYWETELYGNTDDNSVL